MKRQLYRLIRGWRRDRDLDSELASHIELHVADNIRAGMTPDEARRQAHLALGGVEQTKERCRDRDRLRLLADCGRDVMLAGRLLARHRSFAVAAIGVLGVGLAVTNTFFVLTNAIALRGLPIDEPHRVFMVRARDAANRTLGMSYEDVRDIREATHSFVGIGAFLAGPITIGDEFHAAERFQGAYISPEVFSLIGERPLAGRDFTAADDQPDAAPVVIIGRSVWMSRYGANPQIVGTTLRVNGRPATVVGIMPDRSKFMTNAQVWQPLSRMRGIDDQNRGSRGLLAFGRLKPGVSFTDADGELHALWTELGRRFPATNANLRLTVVPINQNYLGEHLDPTWYAFNTAGFLVLLVACANVANLLIMRGATRYRELAVRASLGATRARIFRQLLAESIAIAVGGGLLAFLLSASAVQLLWIATPEGMLPHWMAFRMDFVVFAAIAAMSLLSAVLFGAVPAFQTSRKSLVAALNSGTRGTHRAPSSRRLTSAFVVAQFAIALGSFVAISAAGRSVVDPIGVAERELHSVLTMSISLSGERYQTVEGRNNFYTQVRKRFEELRGVSRIALASNLPMAGAATRGLVLEGQDPDSGAARPMVRSVGISPGYFAALNIPLIRGRDFDDRDSTATTRPVIVNQRFAELYLGGVDPLDQQVTVIIDSAPRSFRVVGVAPVIKQRPGPARDAIVYLPIAGMAYGETSIIVSPETPNAIDRDAVRRVMAALDSDIPLYRVRSLAEAISESDWNRQFSELIAGITGALAVLLSAVGLFAVTMHAITMLTPEIGLRTALGARPRHVLRRVLRGAIVQLALGIAAGVGVALLWDKFFGDPQSPAHAGPIDFVVAAALLTLVACAACVLPAIRALRIDPIIALRE